MTKYALGSHFPLGKIHSLPCWQRVGFLRAYLNHILSALHAPPLFFNTLIYHQYRWSQTHLTFHGK
jgi:hypothetical protein